MNGFTIPDPGEMQARLTLQALLEEPDGQGGLLGNFADVARLWGRVELKAVALSELAGAERAVTTCHVTVYYRDDLAAGQRLLWRDRQLAIRAVLEPDAARRFLLLVCEEESR
ncbi:phage head closure protein [Allorhizobium undicola]|uniref:phage head closure protein n=1 Tax=Allorhizobium undicola TaxID=78527 RepID=UPI000687746B|nr:phage head closure protein [Allorhizobium undicola]